MVNYYNQTVKETLENLNTNPEKGLTEHEVLRRRQKFGSNAIKIKETPLWRKILAPFFDVFMVILIIALILSAVQGNWLEVGTIAVIILVDAGIYYIQSFSTERILRSLKKSTEHAVMVLRCGQESAVSATDLVPGDIVILGEGDRIPADGRILQESGLLTNEAMLTGESETIAKDAKAISGQKKVYEQRNMVFSGSFVVTGSGRFIVTATGDDTEYGKIASLASLVSENSPIAEKIDRLVIQIAIVVVIVAIIALVIQLLNGAQWLEATEFTLAMIVSAVPEGLPIAISIILALCAKRMAEKHALIKELKAIETIGIVTTIASDKTGTLTANKLELQEFWSPNLNKKEFLTCLAGATLSDAAQIENDSRLLVDPLDVCIAEFLAEEKVPVLKSTPLKSYAFDQTLKMSGNLFQEGERGLVLRVKGAPETIIAHSKLTTKEHDFIVEKLNELAGKGFKVLAVASGKLKHEINELYRLEKGEVFTFEGLFAVADALRPEAKSAITTALRMGVQTKMVTGDHAGTSYAIGKELGLAKTCDQVLDCSKLGNVSDEDLADMVKNATVFARVTPEDKYRIMNVMKQSEVCAMTGDGVNDVPALVGAHVGIAMGDSPSIVQDAGDIVLLDNNFKNIIETIRESRTVLANIRRMLSYLLATNAGEVLTTLTSLMLFGGQMLTPIQILWINLVTDSLLVIPLGTEPAEGKILRSKPEPKNAPILSRYTVVRMVLLAILMALITVLTYAISLNVLNSVAQANTLAFTALVVMQWSGALTARGTFESLWQRFKAAHKSFYIALFTAILLQLLALFGPLMPVVGVVQVPIVALLITAVVSFILPIIVIELYKLQNKRES